MATRRAATRRAPAAKPAKKAKATKASGKALVNHIAIVLDRSGSMRSIRGKVITVFNNQLKTIQKNARKTGQETYVGLYTFDNHVAKVYFAKQAQAVPALTTKSYTLGGTTALLDAVGQAITELGKVRGADSDHVSFLVITITDGAENASRKYRANTLSALIKKVQKTGRWSLAFLAPKSGVKTLQRFGIPAGNIQDWSNTAKGATEMGTRLTRGLETFFTARGQGHTAVSKFFTADTSTISDADVKGSLSDVSKEFAVWTVKGKAVIKDFVEDQLGSGKAYEKGRGFYELVKPETVQEQKLIAIMDGKSGAIYEGPAARAMLGLPYSGKIKVKPGSHGSFAVFVMSTSLNRVLVDGSRLLYKTA